MSDVSPAGDKASWVEKGEVEHRNFVEAPSVASKIKQQNAALYAEALDKYGAEGAIDPDAERRLRRKIDFRIIPVLGICYFFYVSCPELCGNTRIS